MQSNEAGMYLKKISNLFERRRNRDLKRHGLTATQLEVLEYLHDREQEACDSMLTDIASFFDVKHTSVLHVIKLLEKKGLILREDKEPGSRLRRISLTEKGYRLMQEIDKNKSAAGRRMLDGLTEEERRQLQSMLERIYKNLKLGEER